MQQVALRPILGRIPTIAPIPHRGLLYLHGSQASEFLNGVLASTVSAPSRGHLFSCFLHAQGRVLYDVFIFSQKDNKGQDGYLIEYDSRPSEAPPILSLLKRYVLRSKVKMEDLSNTYDVWAAWNSEADSGWETKRKWIHSRSGAIEPVWDSNEVWPWGVDEGVLRDRRAVGMGRRLLVPKGEQPKDASTHDIADSVAYNAHRIMHGVPEGIDDIQPMHSFPMESNLDVMGGLDFRKGCYVGQELTVRTYHTGIIRKRIIPVDIQYKGDNAQKEPFSRQIIAIPKKQTDNPQLKSKARSSSKLLTTVDNSALALLRLDHVSAADKGEVIFRLANEDGESVGDSTLTHNWPEWWPKMPVED